MLFGSVCSGIEAASVAWHPLGWRAAWLAEIDPFACAVLAHHYPEVPNIGDMTTLLALIASGEAEAPDLLCGGTPCQAFSVAGLRRSLDDARGNLSLVFCEIANAIDTARAARGEQPAIVFWENVPGVLNTKDNAFGCFLAGLAGEDEPLQPAGGRWTDCGVVLGPSRAIAWRVLEAQYFGLAQRRRRVFVVASARDDFDPVEVLLERDGVRRDLAPSREAGEGAAQRLTTGTGKRYDAETEALVPHGGLGVEPVAFHHACQAAQLPTEGGRDTSVSNPLTCGQVAAVAFPWQSTFSGACGEGVSGTLIKNQTMGVATASAKARRLTPRECERLQGFPDDYTLIPYRNKPAADGPRYKALGNSWAVPVVRWIGQRIAAALQAIAAEIA